jgi:UDP-N-acetylglucosamine:LPS N-acetylglucosamine transferase
MLVVCGPRIDGADLPRPDGVEIRGYVDDLPAQLAACDVAVVQGGLTTTMELVACRRPFVYVPLGDHFEQQRHVRHRLERHHAGRCLDADGLDPDALAEALTQELASPVDYLPVPTDGAVRAASMLAELI